MGVLSRKPRLVKETPLKNNGSVKVTQAYLKKVYYGTHRKNSTPPKLVWQEAHSSGRG